MKESGKNLDPNDIKWPYIEVSTDIRNLWDREYFIKITQKLSNYWHKRHLTMGDEKISRFFLRSLIVDTNFILENVDRNFSKRKNASTTDPIE